MELDEATKAKYCQIYKDFTKPWTSGSVDDFVAVAKAALEPVLADDFKILNGEPVIQTIQGKAAYIESFSAWVNIVSLIHDVNNIWCTDDGWVHVIGKGSMASKKASDTSKIGSASFEYYNKVHINGEGKVDEWVSIWDSKRIMAATM